MDIRELLTELGVRFYEHRESSLVSEGWVGVQCPYCGRAGKPGLGIHTRSLACVCWKCGRHRLGDALAAAADVPVRDVLRRLPGVDAAPGPAPKETGKYLPPPHGPLLAAHRAYLARRGFDPDRVAAEWGAAGIGPDDPRYGWRVFLPVVVGGKPASWTTRAVGRDVTPRYLSAPPDRESHPLKATLFGFDKVRHAAVICEGPFDAIRVGPGGVATCGLTVTPAQVSLLAAVPVRVVCFDNDPAAQRRADALADQLAVFPGSTHVATLSGPDPAESPPDEIADLRRQFLD